jgi:hypothetical protein
VRQGLSRDGAVGVRLGQLCSIYAIEELRTFIRMIVC